MIVPMGDSNSQPLSYKPSALVIELNSSKASSGMDRVEFIQLVYCIIMYNGVSHIRNHFLSVRSKPLSYRMR